MNSSTETNLFRLTHNAGIALAVLALFTATGCASHKLSPPPKAESYTGYRVGAPDKLFVSILPDPRIEREVIVRPDGMITLDLIGDVPAGGRTVVEIAADVQKRISRFKRGATVTVSILQPNSTDITVLGEVRQNKSFPLVKETRLIEAIGMVGGLSAFANKNDIRVIRTGGGETMVFTIDANAIWEGDQRTNILLNPGDIVYVPPTLWARIGYTIQAMLFPFNPLLGLGTTIAGTAIGF